MLRLVGVDGVLDLLVHGEHRVVLVQIHLQRGLVDHPVGLLFQDHEGHAEVVAAINAAVHHKIIELWIAQHRLVIGGDDDAHMVQPDSGPAVGADKVLDDLLVDVLGNGVPCVVALGHDIGDGRHQRRQILYAGSIRAHCVALLFCQIKLLYGIFTGIARQNAQQTASLLPQKGFALLGQAEAPPGWAALLLFMT